MERRVMRGETGSDWYIVEGVCVLGTWAIEKVRRDLVELWMLCWEVRLEGVNGWQQKGIRRGCGDVRRTFGVFAEVCRVLSDPGFVSGVEVVFVAVGSVEVISGTVCAVLGWCYDFWGNSKGGSKQRQKQLQLEPRDLLAMVMFRQLQFNFTSCHSSVPNFCRQQATSE